MVAKVLMVMGTSSSAGKSLLTAALCRCFARRGVRVTPYKSQNMSNNAAVCKDGGEIGRSQALQAQAANTPPQTDMNPILLKPEGDCRSQVIVNGRPLQTLAAADYYQRRKQLWPHATAALDRLRMQYELVIIEGAGSPAELNLTDVEMVNMSVAKYCQAPVLLIGDIERGGIFAQLLGTIWLLPPEERELICGLIVNKFRGDLRLFDEGITHLEQRGEVPVLGVLPWIGSLNLPEEDAATIKHQNITADNQSLDIAVVHFPHIANFDDFDPLLAEPNVHLRFVQTSQELGRPDVVILPGTKNTLNDLQWLSEAGIANEIINLANNHGTSIIGICGGYQMLGCTIHNPHRLESDQEQIDGLNLLDIETTFETEKQTKQVQTKITNDTIAPGSLGEKLNGYEIHIGKTTSSSTWLSQGTQADGAHSSDAQIWGCYLHGIFHNDHFRKCWLKQFGVANKEELPSTNQTIEQGLNQLADVFEEHIDLDNLWTIIQDFDKEKQHVG